MIPTISLILGLVAAPLVPQTGVLLAVLSGCLLLTCLLWRWGLLQSLGVLLCVFLLGMLMGQRIKHPDVNDCVVEAVVFSEPAEKPKTMAVDLLLPQEGRQVRCYLWKDERSKSVALGHNLLVRGVDKGFVRSKDWQFGGQGAFS